MFPIEELREEVRTLTPSSLTGPQAVALVDRYAELERLAAAGKALAAARAAETSQWRLSNARSPEAWLAGRTGASVGTAKQTLQAAQTSALRSGDLSIEQAAIVADAAKTAPESEPEMVAAAKHETVRQLRDRAARIKGAADPTVVHRQRSLRHWVDNNDVWHLHANGTKTDGAAFMARLQPLIDQQFKTARAQERREPLDAYAFDALMTLARSGGSNKPVAKVIIRADLTAVRRGHAADGETCDIAGYGPVDLNALRHMLGENALALVLTDGVDVVNVTHFGRKPTAHQQTALEWSQPTCAVDGCTTTIRLERDHIIDWSTTKHTRLDELQRLCHHHHDLKTRGQLVDGPAP